MSEDIDRPHSRELFGKVCQDIRSRQEWTTRQALWYTMRHGGIPRINKPWPTAADMHYPLIDGTIAKFKPFYFNQLFGTEVVGQFTPKDEAVAPFAQEVGYWFDYKLKQQTNLESEVLIAADRMLMAGTAPIKVYWNAQKGRLAFDSIEPIHCIVPDGTQDIQDADRITLVHHLTCEQYKRDDRFLEETKEPSFIKRLGGGFTSDTGGASLLTQEKWCREGITHFPPESDMIIVWEIWEHTEEGWFLSFISPQCPNDDLRVRQANPYTHGMCPVVRFDAELKDKGFYSSRGIPEQLAPFEKSLSATWNDKLDAMRLYNTPRFSSSSPIPNSGNIRLWPGSLTPGLTAIQNAGRPPIPYDDEMQSTRGVAENYVGTPDYGIGDNNDQSSPRTAHEIAAIGQQAGTGIDMRARIFRLSLRLMLQLAWETLLQHDKDTQYFVAEQAKQLPPEALQSGAWMVLPSGSSESWDKPKALQKAIVRYQMFGPSQSYPQGNPYINQGNLTKSVLATDDPRLIAQLFIDPNATARTEYEDEGTMIPSMLLGLPVQPKPQDDQASRIQAITDFLKASDVHGITLPEIGVNTLHLRVQAMLQMLQQKNPQQAQQIQQALATAHQNVVQMPGAQQPQLNAPPEAAPAGGVA